MQPLMENSVEILQKIKHGSALWLNNSTSGYMSEEPQNTDLKAHMHPHVHCSIIYNSQDMEAAQVLINRQVSKKIVVHVYNGRLLGYKNY